MKKNTKKYLQLVFDAPAPTEKQAFLNTLQPPSITLFSFMLTQIAYIRKWVWFMSSLLFAAAVAGSLLMSQDILWMLSAFIPFLALSIITENARSSVYQMAELEMASRFSLKSLILARMGILGIFHFLLLCLLLPLTQIHGVTTLLQSGVYLLVPYLLTTILGLWLIRRIPGKEAFYACMGMAVTVSGVSIILKYTAASLYHSSCFRWWIAALILLLLLAAFEYYKTIHETEGMICSLSQIV